MVAQLPLPNGYLQTRMDDDYWRQRRMREEAQKRLEMEMNKQEALTRLAEIEAETAKLLEIIDAPDPVKALLETVEPGSRVTYWVPNWNCEVPLECEANVKESCELYDLAFVTEKQAADYRRAFATMVALRRQPGTEPPIDTKEQFIVEPISGIITYDSYCTFRAKVSKLSPCFDSRETAKAAIATIGEDRIMHMYETLQGVEQ